MGARGQASGGTVIAGGGVLSERKIFTPGGHKNGRRPDIIYVDENGKRVYGNVGKVKADGETPIAREQKAMEDLRTKASQEDASDEVQLRAYNKPCP